LKVKFFLVSYDWRNWSTWFLLSFFLLLINTLLGYSLIDFRPFWSFFLLCFSYSVRNPICVLLLIWRNQSLPQEVIMDFQFRKHLDWIRYVYHQCITTLMIYLLKSLAFWVYDNSNHRVIYHWLARHNWNQYILRNMSSKQFVLIFDVALNCLLTQLGNSLLW
jgi:hypothetical protein